MNAPFPARNLVSCLALALTLALAGCSPKESAAPEKRLVRHATVRPAASIHRGGAEYVGVLKGDIETDLGFKVGGILELIGPPGDPEGWREGTAARKGSLLAQLNQNDFESAAKEARARLDLTDATLRRTAELFTNKTVSAQEYDVARANRDSAHATFERARQALGDSRIEAPYDGTILFRMASAGETIAPGKPVLHLADLSQMSLEIGVPDTLVGRLTQNMPARVRVSALDGLECSGRVSEIGVAARPGTRLFKVIIKIPNTDRRLKPGMSATVDFSGASPLPENAVVVPLSAIVTGSGARSKSLAVFVLDDSGHVRERIVQTEDIVRSSIVVLDGLKAGERVITSGAPDLYDGALVDSRPEGRE
jgi:RND family efflux transporter MFP subunit